MQPTIHPASLILTAALLAAPAGADYQSPAPLSALETMPVKEVTIFKDGHALVLQRGELATDAAGNVLLDELPAPVLGTFWPTSFEGGAKLTAVVSGQRRVNVDQTALTIRELLEANIGATVTITERLNDKDFDRYQATIVGIPARGSKELDETISPDALRATNQPGTLPLKGNVIELRTTGGLKIVPIDSIRDVTFEADHKARVSNEEFRNLLTLKLDWAGVKPDASADVGMMYLQRGLRWIPSYKIDIDGEGHASIKLQATLINELIDLDDATANLVIGMPNFFFKDTVDPIAIQGAVAQLSQYFQERSQTAAGFSNALMAQTARMGEYRGRVEEAMSLPGADAIGPEVSGSERSEDLFVFTVNHVTLKRGQRMVLPVAEFKLNYSDVYKLDLPIAPPVDVAQHFNPSQEEQIARLLRGPKAMHNLRMTNDSKFPITTAPALVVANGRVLAQGMTTYTAVGGSLDLELTAAVDVRVKRTDREVQRVPNAVVWQGDQYWKIDLAGVIELTNFKDKPVALEVTRHVLGNVDKADHGGKAEMISIVDDWELAVSGPLPQWWSWYSWPYWWRHFNGMGKFTWKLTLQPQENVDLNYTWHYFWR
jgi:hypothetical protein